MSETPDVETSEQIEPIEVQPEQEPAPEAESDETKRAPGYDQETGEFVS